MTRDSWLLVGVILGFILMLKFIGTHEQTVGHIFRKYDKTKDQLKSCKKMLDHYKAKEKKSDI